MNRYYTQTVSSDGVGTPKYTWTIFDGSRSRDVTVPGDGFLGPLGGTTEVYYGTGRKLYLPNLASGTDISVSVYLSAGASTKGISAGAESKFYDTGVLILSAEDRPQALPALPGSLLVRNRIDRYESHQPASQEEANPSK